MTLRAFLLLSVLVTGSVQVHAQPSSARVRGRLVAADTGQPVRFAQVRIADRSQAIARSVSTDAAGLFDFDGLPAGHYALSASKGGFVTLEYGQRRPFEPGTPVDLAIGQTRDVVFPLARGSVIAGRITDDQGDPVPHATVSAARYVYRSGGSRVLESSEVSDSTDDLGQFRLFGLMPGDYIVSASAGAEMTSRQRGTPGQATGERHATTYYPGVMLPAYAATVSVGLGQETTAHFSLMSARLSTVSGTVSDSAGRPAAGAEVTISAAAGDDNRVGRSARSRADGSFVLAGVPPGEHLLIARVDPRGAGRGSEVATMTVTVGAEADITGLSMATAAGATISGMVGVQGRSAPPPPGLSIAAVSLDARLPSGAAGRGSDGRTGPDGRFALGGLFGPVRFELAGPSSAAWAIVSATLNGRDVTDRAAQVDAAEPGVLRIVVTETVTDLVGTVTDGQGTARREFVVVLLPEGLPAGVLPDRFVRVVRPLRAGQFRVQGLPPGTYRAALLESLAEGTEWDPQFQAWAREHGVSVRLEGGREVRLDLRFQGSTEPVD